MKEVHLMRGNWFSYVIGAFIPVHQTQLLLSGNNTNGRNQSRRHMFDYP